MPVFSNRTERRLQAVSYDLRRRSTQAEACSGGSSMPARSNDRAAIRPNASRRALRPPAAARASVLASLLTWHEPRAQSRPSLVVVHAPHYPRDCVEEHLDEASFLSAHWEAAQRYAASP